MLGKWTSDLSKGQQYTDVLNFLKEMAWFLKDTFHLLMRLWWFLTAVFRMLTSYNSHSPLFTECVLGTVSYLRETQPDCGPKSNVSGCSLAHGGGPKNWTLADGSSLTERRLEVYLVLRPGVPQGQLGSHVPQSVQGYLAFPPLVPGSFLFLPWS